MWYTLLCCLVVGGVAGVNQQPRVLPIPGYPRGWIPVQRRYTYNVEGRTLSAIHEVSNKFTGIFLRGQLILERPEPTLIRGQVREAKYAQVNQDFSNGWKQNIPDSQLKWKDLPLRQDTFDAHINDTSGEVEILYVNSQLQLWEVNVIKGLLSQIQLTTQPSFKPVYRVKESIITGRCHTLYDFSPLLKTEMKLWNYLDNDNLQVTRTQNISHCNSHLFHLKFSGFEHFTDRMNNGGFISNNVVTRMVVDSVENNLTVIASNTVHKVILSPEYYNTQHAMTVSFMNVTLEKKSNQLSLHPVSDPRNVGDLVYLETLYERHDQQYLDSSYASASSSSSSSRSRSSSSESSEETDSINIRNRENKQRSPRAISQKKRMALMQELGLTTPLPYPRRLRSISLSAESSSSSSSRSSPEISRERNPRYIKDEENTFLPLTHVLRSDVDPVKAVVQLANDIGHDLIDPDSLPDKDTITKFIIMVRVLRNLQLSEILDIAQQLQVKLDSQMVRKDSPQWEAWKSFRDAVSQTGTHAAVHSIIIFLSRRYISQSEAQDLFNVLPAAVQHHDMQYINNMFDLIKDPVVQQDRHVNETVVIAFSNAYRFIHARLKRPYISPYFIKYLFQEFENAYRRQNTTQMQVYVHALGNTGDVRIIPYLEPYLLRQIHLSAFQRAHMFKALERVVDANPHLLTRFFLKFLLDQTDHPDVRVQAVFLLMRSDPSVAVLRTMAELTHSEPVNQVVSAIQAAIRTAARLRGTRFYNLAFKAQTVVNLLSDKNLDVSYSKNYMLDQEAREYNLDFQLFYEQIGSQDNLLPKSALLDIFSYVGGAKSDHQTGYTVSSIDKVLNDIQLQFKNFTQQGWTQQQMRDDLTKLVEGNIQYQVLGVQRFWPFDQDSIKSIPNVIQKFVKDYREVKSFNLTKFFTTSTGIYGFPTVMGFPGVYTLHTPSLWKADGELKVTTVPDLEQNPHYLPGIVDVQLRVRPLYAAKLQSKLSVITPFNDMRYTAGVNRHFHSRSLPVKIHAEMNYNNMNDDKNNNLYAIRANVKQYDSDKDHRVLYMSSIPFTTIHDIRSLNPDSKDDDFQILHVRPMKKYNRDYGQDVGQAVKLQYETEDDYVDLKLSNKNMWLSNALSPLPGWMTSQIIYRKLDVTYATRQCTNNVIELSAVLANDQQNNQYPNTQNDDGHSARKHKARRTRSARKDDRQSSGERSDSNPAIPSDTKPDSDARRQQYLRAAREQVRNNASSYVLDLGVNFKGQNPAYIVFTGAYAKSLVNGNSNHLVFYNQQFLKPEDNKQVCLSANIMKPQMPLNNYDDALQSDPTSQVRMILNAGNKCQEGSGQATVDGKLQRTKEYEKFIKDWALARECQNDMDKYRNYLLRDCQNVTYRADDLKDYTFRAIYDNKLPDFVKERLYQAYALLRNRLHRHVSEDPFKIKANSGQLDLSVQLNNVSKVFNLTLESALGESRFINVPVHDWAGNMLSVNPRTSIAERLAQYELPLYNNPTCALDNSAINTFDNLTIYNRFENKEYTLMQVKDQDTTLRVRKIDVRMKVQDSNKDVKIITEKATVQLKHNNDKPDVYFQDRKISYTNNEATPLMANDHLFGYVYGLPKKSVMVVLSQPNVAFVYENQRFLLQASNIYRNKTRGLCGNMDGEEITDLLTPNECYELDYKKFFEAYTNGNQHYMDKTCIRYFPIDDMNYFPKQQRQRNPAYPSDLSDVLSKSISGTSSQTSSASSMKISKPSFSLNFVIHSSHSHSIPILIPSHSSSSQSHSRPKHSRPEQSRSSSSASRSRHSASRASRASSQNSDSESRERTTTQNPMDNSIRPNIHRKQNMVVITRVVRRDTDVCFSAEPLKTCIDNSRAADTRIQQQQFICLPDSPASEHYLKLIKKGINPDFTRKKNFVQLEVKIPTKCIKSH
uniref:Vitellogenin-2 n=1 Tax=Rhyparobia maderae TaxID=36963 RepID=Q5TLA5_RHYMA|nr:vitellogenin-2 [Rhyparobia maderae]